MELLLLFFFFLFFPYRTKATNKHVVSSPESCQQFMSNMPFYSHLVKEKKKKHIMPFTQNKEKGWGRIASL
jgi:hypothetical protein